MIQPNYPPGNYHFTLSIGFDDKHEETFRIPDVMGFSDEDWLNMQEHEREREVLIAWTRWNHKYIDGGVTAVEPLES